MKACKDFKPFVTNKDVCDHWMIQGPGFGPLSPDIYHPTEKWAPYCRKGLACPTCGQRPERLDQESDSDE